MDENQNMRGELTPEPPPEDAPPLSEPKPDPHQITAKGKNKEGIVQSVSVEYDFGDNLNDATQEFGENLVFAKFKASAKIDAQAKIRRDIEAGKTPEQIRESFLTWKPGMPVERRTKDPVDVIVSKWKDMTEDARANMLRALKAAE